MYTALQIAHFVIDYCNQIRRPVSNLELQKIMYFLQVFFMRENAGRSLIADDFCAWKYGPVVPSVYSIYSGYGGGLIGNSYNCSDIDGDIIHFMMPLVQILESMGPWGLVDLTHREGTPWYKIFNNGIGNWEVIPKELIAQDDTQI